MQKFKLIIGLGNPDPKYEETYHNIGYLLVDHLQNLKFKVLNLKLMKSDVYMNESGAFVKEQIKKFKIKPEQLLIVHDDSDIELGFYKLSFGRNSAGHHGVQNIINQLKTKDFWRLRIGIRPHSALRASQSKPRPTADKLVLKKILPVSKKRLEEVFTKAIKELVLSEN